MARVRLLRIIEYEGDEAWVREQINKREVKGTKAFVTAKYGACTIREGIIGETGSLIDQTIEVAEQE